MERMIAFYNSEVERFERTFRDADKQVREAAVASFIDTDPTKISWDHAQKIGVERSRYGTFMDTTIKSMYRPFTKSWLYFDRFFNNRVYQMPRIFPNAVAKNRVICISGNGAKNGFSALMTDVAPDLQLQFNGQCFPRYLYVEFDKRAAPTASANIDLFTETQQIEADGGRRDALTDEGLAHFQAAYQGEEISKDDVFYYVYGLLHSPEYRERYADNLNKELPRIPCVKTITDFRAFSTAGRTLADLHVNYETVEMYTLEIDSGGRRLTDSDHRVEKMKYGKNGKGKDLTTLIYNDKITVKGIPLEAYEYVVNGKPALDWVVERQCVKIDKDSGIVNDANDYAVETMNNPRYPLELFQRVVTVSLETMKIVKSLPHLDIQQPGPTVGQLMEAKDEPDALTA